MLRRNKTITPTISGCEAKSRAPANRRREPSGRPRSVQAARKPSACRAVAGNGAGCRRDGALSWRRRGRNDAERSEEHTSELQSLMRNSYAVFCLKKKNKL